MNLLELVVLGVGGGLGAVVRGWARRWNGAWPRGTLAANLTGTALLGGILGFGVTHPWAELMVLVGFCGALTTFSSFVVEVCLLAQVRRWRRALGYMAATLLGSAGVFALAHGLGSAIF